MASVPIVCDNDSFGDRFAEFTRPADRQENPRSIPEPLALLADLRGTPDGVPQMTLGCGTIRQRTIRR